MGPARSASVSRRAGGDRRGPRQPVDDQPGGALIARDGGSRGRAEDEVDAAGRVASAPEQELQRADVPAPGALRDHARAEPGPAQSPERAPGLRAGDAVDDQPAPPLKAAHATGRERPANAVDGNRIQPVRLQGRLQRRRFADAALAGCAVTNTSANAASQTPTDTRTRVMPLRSRPRTLGATTASDVHPRSFCKARMPLST